MHHFYYTFLIHLVAAFIVLPGAAQSLVKGQVILRSSLYYLKFTRNGSEHLILAKDKTLQSRLRCLKHGDYLSGSAYFIHNTHIDLQSIDYVGLKDLVGTWQDGEGIFKFTDFRNFQYWQGTPSDENFRGPFKFRYTLSPAGKNLAQCGWKIFISDSSGVIFGGIKWTAEDQIRMDLYDTDTGEILSTKHLVRTSTPEKSKQRLLPLTHSGLLFSFPLVKPQNKLRSIEGMQPWFAPK